MPYANVSELPPAVRNKLSPKKQRQWMHVWNSEYSRHKDESRAFAGAWSTVQKGFGMPKPLAFEVDSTPMSENFNFFLPLSKVEKTKDGGCIVSGYASTPTLDIDGEIISIDAVKSALPGYWQWRNIREMHQPSAVGVAQEANVDGKGLFLTAKISDKEAAQKCIDGVYKGYSVGGKKLAKTGNVITKIDLVEISVVDRPANPDCKLEIQKSAIANSAAYLTKLPKQNKSAKAETALNSLSSVSEFLKSISGAAGLCKLHKVAGCEKCICAKHAKVDCEKCATKAAKKAEKATQIAEFQEWIDDNWFGKREYSTDKRKEYASSGVALPDGSFPIPDKDALSDAIHAFGRAGNKPRVKKHIISRARALGASSMLPEDWIRSTKGDSNKTAKFNLSGSAGPSFLTLKAANRVFGPDSVLGEAGSGHEFGFEFGGELENGGRKLSKALSKRMQTAGSLSYCFDSIREAQRSLLREGKLEGGDMKDKALAQKLGEAARVLAEVIGQKADHEGQEAIDLSDADDQGLMSYLGEDFEMSANTDDLGNVLMNLAKAARQPTRFQHMQSGKAAMKKALKARKSAKELISSLHKMHKASYLSKMAKAVKKPVKDDDDDDDGDFDHAGAMEKLQKAYGEISTMKTFMKAANEHFVKAAGRVGQQGQEVADGNSFYEVPAGIKDKGIDQMVRTSPGGSESGSEPPILDMTTVFPGKAAQGKALNGVVSIREAELMAKNAGLEAQVDLLSKLPAMPASGRRPAAFDTTTLLKRGANSGETQALFKNIDQARFQSEDPDTHNNEVAKVIGNMITGQIGAKSMFNPEFHGTAGA